MSKWTHLSVAISPEIHSHTDRIVDSWVGSLVQQCGSQSSHRQKHQSRLNTPVQCRPGDESKRPFPRKEEDAEHEVDDLQDREGLHCKVKVLGEEVPEDLRPEEAFKCCCYLVWSLLASEYCPG